MAAHAGQHVDLGVDADLLIKKPDLFDPVHQQAAERPVRLVADEEDAALRPPEIVLEVVADTPGVAHAARGEDDLGGAVLVDGLGLQLCQRKLQPREEEGVHAVADHGLDVLMQELGVALEKDAGGLGGEGAVHIDGEVAVALDKVELLDLPQEKEHLLRAPHGKAGDDHVAAAVEGLLDAR